MDEMEPVFKALADPHRRLLLDRLHERDGRTLLELQGVLPAMSRFGVMKHLKLLEDAGLLTTQKVGREKFHYLNPVPIQQVYDRWVSKYAKPWALALTGLKYALEEPETMSATAVATTSHVLQVYIRTTPERLWQALTDGAMTKLYYFGATVESTWEPGAPYRYARPDGAPMLEGQVLESDPPRKLVTTFHPRWSEEDAAAPPSKVTFEIEPVGNACKLLLTHEDLIVGTAMATGVFHGWSQILSGLKTLLETGDALELGAM